MGVYFHNFDFSFSHLRVGKWAAISSLEAGACGVLGVEMFVVVSDSVLVPLMWVAAVERTTHPRPTLGPIGPMGYEKIG